MTLLHIFDASAFQGPTMRQCDAAFIKATEGKSYTSSRFPAQWASAKTQAKRRGGYHFARPEEGPAKDQADRFLDVVQPRPGELLWLDLEASKLSQSATNVWARAFGDRLWDQAPGVTTGAYLGAGYASNGTGRDLNKHFNLWWYPQYPSTYRLAAAADVEQMRAANRSEATPGRIPLAAMTSSWPGTVSPWLPPGLTVGWDRPHIWQFTDNWNGWDASVSALTLDQLAGGGQPQKETDVYGGIPPLQVGHRITRTCPKGSLRIIGIANDSMNVLTYRIAAHSQSGGGKVQTTLKVGGPASDKDSWPRKATWTFPNASEVDWFSIELVDGDPSQPDANGKIVEPGWDAS